MAVEGNGAAINVMRRMNVGDIPKRSAAKFGDKIAIVYQDRRITFNELNENCCRMAHLFQELGAEKGDRISFMTHNCLHYIYSWFGACKIGCVVNPLNFMLKPREIHYIVNHAESRLFFVEDALLMQALKAAPDLKSVEKFGVIYVEEVENILPDGWLNMNTLFESIYDTSEPMVITDNDDMASLIYTSGTEALPKGVMNTHSNFFNSLMSGVADLHLKANGVGLLSIPLYHVAGKYFLLEFINLGCKVILEYAPNPMEILKLTQDEKVTTWIYPPTLFQILPAMRNFDSYDLSSLKKCISFGAVMPPSLLRQWKELLPDLMWLNYYGQTESSPLGSSLQPEDFERRIDSIGRPHTGVEIKIFDDHDNELPVGKVGEIVMRSPSVMKGYFKNDEDTAEALKNGWLHTSDLGRFDSEGFLYFVDRKKDMIKSAGENVSSQEVEGVIYKHEKVMQVAVIGMPDDYWTEAVTACVVPYPEKELTEDEIISFCKKTLAGYKVPKRVVIMEMKDLPVLPSGKILKRQLRVMLEPEKK